MGGGRTEFALEDIQPISRPPRVADHRGKVVGLVGRLKEVHELDFVGRGHDHNVGESTWGRWVGGWVGEKTVSLAFE